LAHRDDVTASVSVVEAGSGSRALRINGSDRRRRGQHLMPMMSHLPMLLHLNPLNVLVICFGTGRLPGGTVHPGVHVDVDINPAADFAPYFERTNHGLYWIAAADHGRRSNFLLTTRETYDDYFRADAAHARRSGQPHYASTPSWRASDWPRRLLVQWLPSTC
jgi:hypothetical protein